MAYIYGISPVRNYPQNFTGVTTNNDQTQGQKNKPKRDDQVHEYANSKLGSASTKVAKKGIKYVWKNVRKTIKEFFKKNEKLVEDTKTVYDVANNANKVVTVYQEITGDNTQPKHIQA